jgi:hypothetical protein
MTPQPVDNSLEALSHLLDQIRLPLDDPAKATSYLDFTDKVLIDIAANRPLTSPGNASPYADNLGGA